MVPRPGSGGIGRSPGSFAADSLKNGPAESSIGRSEPLSRLVTLRKADAIRIAALRLIVSSSPMD
jgi:hypothetical protein